MKRRFIILAMILLAGLSPVICEAQTEADSQEPFPYAELVQLTVAREGGLIDICRQYMDAEHRWKAVAVINRIEKPDERIAAGTKLMVPLAYLKGTPLEGKVTFVKGDAKVQKEGQGGWVPLKQGDVVLPSSNLKTGRDSALEITFEDGSAFLLRSDTSMGILKAFKITASRLFRDLFIGAGRVVTRVKEATGAAPRFNVHTPSAIAAVRGTEFRVAVDDQQKTYAEALLKRIAVSAAAASVDLNEGEGTTVKKGEPPQPPRKLLPPPGPLDLKPIYNSLPISVSFANIKGAQAYRIVAAADKEGKQSLLEKVIDPRETFKIPKLVDASYYLITQSIDEAGLEGRAEPFSFRVRVNPMPPMIQVPREGASVKGKSAKFEWMSVSDAVKYRLQIAEDRSFSVFVLDKTDLKATSFKTGDLEYKTYYFRLGSIAADDYQGAWSDPLPFTLVPPETPSMERPDVSKDEINLRSKSLGEGMIYHFQIARENLFKEILLDHKADKPEITIQKPKDAGVYFVRVAGIDRDGVISDFSAPQSFEIKDRIPYEWAGGWLGAVLLFFLLAP